MKGFKLKTHTMCIEIITPSMESESIDIMCEEEWRRVLSYDKILTRTRTIGQKFNLDINYRNGDESDRSTF